MKKRSGVTLFIMDAPNVDQSVATILGRKPTAADRPQLDKLMDWMEDRSRNNRRLHAWVFANLADEPAAKRRQQNWASWLRRLGYKSKLKPRTEDDGDVDFSMIMQLRSIRMNETVNEVIIASNDGWCFLDDLIAMRKEGTYVTILGFEEFPSVLTRRGEFEFISYREIPDVFPNLPAPTPKLQESP